MGEAGGSRIKAGAVLAGASRLHHAVQWRVLVPLALATLLLAVGAFVAWQTWLVWHTQYAIEQAESARTAAVTAIAAQVRQTEQRVEQALGESAVQQALREDGALGRDRAATALKATLPAANDAAFFSPDLDEVLSGDLTRIGYAKAAALMQAKVRPEAPLAEMRVEKAVGRQLMIALPARVDGQVRAFAVVEWPFAPILALFERTPSVGARLDLRQGDGRGDLTIASIGRGGSTIADLGVPIPGTTLRIGNAPPDYFIVVPHNLALLVALTLLCLIGGGVALWLRQVGMQNALAMLQRSPRSTLPEITLAEAMKQHPAAAPTPASATGRAATTPASEEATRVDASIFRAYDIRGVVGQTLTPASRACSATRSAAMRVSATSREIVVGRDGRLSGPELVAALIDGLRKTGCDVIDIGAVPTPVAYFASFHLRTGSGVSVTGSHNPPDYNGFKIVLGGETLSDDAIQDLYARIAENRFRRWPGRPADDRRQRRLHASASPTTSRSSASSRSSSTAATASPAQLRRRVLEGDRLRGRAAVLRRRRHLPEPPSRTRRTWPTCEDLIVAVQAGGRRPRPGASTATATASAWSPRPAR